MTGSSSGSDNPPNLTDLQLLILTQEQAENRLRVCSDAYGQAEIALHRAGVAATQAREAVKAVIKDDTVVKMGHRWVMVNRLGVLRELQVIE